MELHIPIIIQSIYFIKAVTIQTEVEARLKAI